MVWEDIAGNRRGLWRTVQAYRKARILLGLDLGCGRAGGDGRVEEKKNKGKGN
jgi:hypothetical protein